MLSFESLKSGFREYLEGVNKERHWTKYKTNDETKSIFMYSKEFQEYLATLPEDEIAECTKALNKVLPGVITNSGNDDLSALNVVLDEEQTSLEEDENDVISGLMDDLLQDEDFQKALDTDGDGEISDDELTAFYETIKVMMKMKPQSPLMISYLLLAILKKASLK